MRNSTVLTKNVLGRCIGLLTTGRGAETGGGAEIRSSIIK